MTFTDRTAAIPLRAALLEFWMFGLKQAWACLFGGAMLTLILGTHLFYPAGAILPRYDFLLIAALALQALLIAAHLETRDEAIVIFLCHMVGTAMEIFKTEMGSWNYPEESFARIGGAWIYLDQAGGWRPAPIAKMGSWLLLTIISFVLVTLVRRPRPEGA